MTDTTADAGHGHDHGHDHEDAIHAANPHLQHHYDTPQQQFDAGKLGIWIFLVTEILFFSGLFCAYTVYRAEHPEVFIFAHYYLSAWLGGVNTAVLILSSLTAAWAVRNAQLQQHKLLVMNILITIACASTFIVIHAHEYYEHYERGLMWTDCEASNGKPLSRLRFGVCFKPKEHVWELQSFKDEHPEAAVFAEKLYKLEQRQKAKKTAQAAPIHLPADRGVQFASLTATAARAGRTIPVASATPAPGSAAPKAAGAAKPAQQAKAKPKKKKKAKAQPSARAAAPAAAGSAPAPSAGAAAAPSASAAAAPSAGAAAAPSASAAAAPPASAAPAPSASAPATAPAPAPAAASKPGSAKALIQALATEEARSGNIETDLGKKMKPLIAAGVIGPTSAGGVSYPKDGHVFFALYFFMTGLHSFHVFIGIIIWLWMLTRALKKEFGPKYFGPIDYTALYWHLVDMIWIYLFPLLYLIR